MKIVKGYILEKDSPVCLLSLRHIKFLARNTHSNLLLSSRIFHKIKIVRSLNSMAISEKNGNRYWSTICLFHKYITANTLLHLVPGLKHKIYKLFPKLKSLKILSHDIFHWKSVINSRSLEILEINGNYLQPELSSKDLTELETIYNWITNLFFEYLHACLSELKNFDQINKQISTNIDIHSLSK